MIIANLVEYDRIVIHSSCSSVLKILLKHMRLVISRAKVPFS